MWQHVPFPRATREQHGKEVHAFLDELPATTLPVLVGGDMNTPVRWGHREGERVEASGPESKADYDGPAREQRYSPDSTSPPPVAYSN